MMLRAICGDNHYAVGAGDDDVAPEVDSDHDPCILMGVAELYPVLNEARAKWSAHKRIRPVRRKPIGRTGRVVKDQDHEVVSCTAMMLRAICGDNHYALGAGDDNVAPEVDSDHDPCILMGVAELYPILNEARAKWSADKRLRPVRRKPIGRTGRVVKDQDHEVVSCTAMMLRAICDEDHYAPGAGDDDVAPKVDSDPRPVHLDGGRRALSHPQRSTGKVERR
ncbi:hypothetical protein V5799_011833 [Amblyomma americanum]|uniref:Uncharacterized protein n=1 Tax=Amblyomma americanum TaxID=6943 RepID=A0AAQ4EG39_AMBAM